MGNCRLLTVKTKGIFIPDPFKVYSQFIPDLLKVYSLQFAQRKFRKSVVSSLSSYVEPLPGPTWVSKATMVFGLLLPAMMVPPVPSCLTGNHGMSVCQYRRSVDTTRTGEHCFGIACRKTLLISINKAQQQGLHSIALAGRRTRKISFFT